MFRASSNSNTSHNVAITTQPTVHPSLWTRFVDSFKPPEGSDPLNDVDPSCTPHAHPWGEAKKKGEGMAAEVKAEEVGEVDERLGGGAGMVDGDGSHETGRLKRNLHGRHLQVTFYSV